MRLKDINGVLFPWFINVELYYSQWVKELALPQCGIVRLQAADSERELITYAKLNTNETCSEI